MDLRSGFQKIEEMGPGCGMIVVPAPDGMGEPLRVMVGEAPGNDEDSCVGCAGLKRFDRQANEIVPVAGDEDPSLPRGDLELLAIAVAAATDLVNARGIESQSTGRFGRYRA